ncbi:hypothetical protein SBA3_3200015 [Candidatus Sulfopaludibacter sp. SbA3]|nr:hypothetical protein SBA3_3200015 [Candidatus Sulfopaludibacter sp. SbA3]
MSSPALQQFSHRLQVATRGKGLYEITGQIAQWLSGCGVSSGLLTVFVQHTSASLTIQENADPDVVYDLNAFFGRRGLRPERVLWPPGIGRYPPLPPYHRGPGRYAGAHPRGTHPHPTLHPGGAGAPGPRNMAGCLCLRASRRRPPPFGGASFARRIKSYPVARRVTQWNLWRLTHEYPCIRAPFR